MSGVDGAGSRPDWTVPATAGVGESAGASAACAPASPQLKGDATLDAVARGEQTIASGSRGAAAKKVQEALRALGSQIVADGAFGPKSAAALKEFQKSAGLPETGKVDAPTLRALDRRLLGLDSPAPARPAAPASPTYDMSDIDELMPPTIGVRPAPARTTTIAPRPPARPTPPAPGPTNYDNWFTDADELTVPREVRRYLDQALRTGSHSDIRALRFIDIDLGTTAERVKLVEQMLAGSTQAGDEQWILEMLQRKPDEAGRIFEGLAAHKKLGALFSDFDGDTRARLLKQLPSMVANSNQASAVVGALLESDTRENRLAAHHVFDRARAGGYLDQSLAKLKAAHPASAVVNDLIAQAKPTRRPMVIAHRGGDAVHFPENTMPAIRDAVEKGDEAIEIDITVTKDDQIILWHDYDPGDLVAGMREMGIEPGGGFKPWKPQDGPARRPIYELNLPAVRANYGYSKRDGNLLTNDRVDVEIPRLDEVAAYARQHPELKKIILDIKLPPDKPEVQHKFAVRLKQILEQNGLQDRVILMQNDAGTVAHLKRDMGDRYPITHDVEIISLAPSASNYSAVASAERLHNTVASVGRPRVGIGGYETYLEVLKKDRQRLNASGHPQQLLTWTINDELELREIMAIGVDGILTDNPALLRKLIAAYKL